jgi:L-threonylcarbamoyladenylate synthase
LGNSNLQIRKIHPENIPLEAISRLAIMLKQGGVAIYPTETFYAIGVVPTLAEAVERIFTIKGRDFRKALPLIASDRQAVLRAVSEWPEIAERLADAFWPGPLTLILPAAKNIPPALHAGTGKIAVRISSLPIASLLAESTGGLIVSTSANMAGRPAPSSPGTISPSLLEEVDGVLDYGDLPGGLPSTIVDVTAHPVTLVRTGAIEWDAIQKAVE